MHGLRAKTRCCGLEAMHFSGISQGMFLVGISGRIDWLNEG